jgi:sterol desaturase/sphingolipid hydroxylase (fatty acid hydroxylase superfamily)
MLRASSISSSTTDVTVETTTDTDSISDNRDDKMMMNNASTKNSRSTSKHSTKRLSQNATLAAAAYLMWPLMSTLPLILSSSQDLPTHYTKVFRPEWYHYDATNNDEIPKPLGLSLGILAVFIGHVLVVQLFYIYCYYYTNSNNNHNNTHNKPKSIQTAGARSYNFFEGLQSHISQPEGFVLLSLYLTLTWMLDLMPPSYYSFEGSIQWSRVFACLVTQDGIQYMMHRLEHSISPEFYKASHKPHHKYTNPRLFDAFDGSVTDTVLMILLPLYGTANIISDCNVWTYMCFGSMYANWLVLIHSEVVLPWDGMFRKIGFGTPGDHHVHHKLFKYNYGHLFMWFDQLGGTYRDPQQYAPKLFQDGV